MRETPPMMDCGHAANAEQTDGDGTKHPVCVICAGIRPGALTIAAEQPDLTNRRARCSYCQVAVASKPSLAFFEHRVEHQFDSWYCGCRGWD